MTIMKKVVFAIAAVSTLVAPTVGFSGDLATAVEPEPAVEEEKSGMNPLWALAALPLIALAGGSNSSTTTTTTTTTTTN